MNITYNNMELASNLITFTDIPNILKVEDADGGTYATMTFQFIADFSTATTADNQWYITFLGETISNVLNPSNALNKNFYVSNSTTSTAASVARALRNCPTVAANFNIEHDTNMVILTAKAVGVIWSATQNYLDYNISSTYMTAIGTDGSAISDLYGSKIDVDVYADSEYVTTLEKNFYGGEAAFNMSPVITTFAEYGKIVPYTFRISSIINGNYQLLGNIDANYASVGYMCNQGNKYLFNDYANIAQNYSRGENQDADNNTILYLYKPEIDISLYTGNNGGFTYQIDYLDSAFNRINSYDITSTFRCSSNSLIDLKYTLNHSGYAYFQQAFYIDLTIGNFKIRYKVIKPIKATEYYQRVYWRNSYGGISFFDFTGQKSETRDVETTTYEKNIFGYYTDSLFDKPLNELEKAYDNKVKYTVTLKSHLFENDGKYIFNDLLQSGNIWTEINGEFYTIIIDSLSVDETDNNNVYEATLKYHYSQEPSII